MKAFKPLTREERIGDFHEKFDEAFFFFFGPPYLSRENIARLQSLWKKWGYYTGKIDGIWGPKTEKAYWKWKETLALQKKVNDVLKSYGEGIREDGLLGRETRGAIRKVQRILKEMGYYAGKIDGIWGPKTERAYQQFKELSALKPKRRAEYGEGERANPVAEKLARRALDRSKELLGRHAPVLVVYAENPNSGVGMGYLYDEKGHLLKKIPISFSPHGLGFTPASGRTPTGLLFVRAGTKPKKGKVVRISSVTKTPVYEVAWAVEGLEKENKNTSRRRIAFHGVSPNSQWKVGKRPASAGCYTARSEDLLELYRYAVPTKRGRGFLLVVYSPLGPKTAFLEEAEGFAKM